MTYIPGGVGVTEIASEITHAAGLTCANNAVVPISWTTEVMDRGGMVDLGADPTIITIPAAQAGVYSLSVFGSWAASSSGYRRLYSYVNTVAVLFWQFAPDDAANPFYMRANTLVDLAAGDTVEMRFRQTSGGNLDISSLSWTTARVH